MDEQLQSVLIECLEARDLSRCRQAMLEFANKGGLQNTVIQTLEELRNAPNIDEDIVLEALDLASGWCSPSMQIWPT